MTADPEVAEMVAAALRSWSMPDVPPPDLEEHPAGECADCRKPCEVLRSYGDSGRPLCPKCLGARLRVAAKLAERAEVGTQP